MSAGTALVGAAVSGIWKLAAIVLAAALLVVASSTGTGWWLAVSDRNQARVALSVEKGVSVQLRASIAEQNRAVEGMAAATMAAQERGKAAQAQAALIGKRYDAAQTQIAEVRASTCDDAMPTINLLLESVR